MPCTQLSAYEARLSMALLLLTCRPPSRNGLLTYEHVPGALLRVILLVLAAQLPRDVSVAFHDVSNCPNVTDLLQAKHAGPHYNLLHVHSTSAEVCV